MAMKSKVESLTMLKLAGRTAFQPANPELRQEVAAIHRVGEIVFELNDCGFESAIELIDTLWKQRDAAEHRAAMMAWRPIETAPTDGTKIWGWLYDSGIVLMHWVTAEQNAAAEGSDAPDEYIACWVKSGDPDDGDWSPKFWLPFEVLSAPPGITWTGRRWRDTPSVSLEDQK